MTAAASAATSDAMVVEIFVTELAGGVVRVRAPLAPFDASVALVYEDRCINQAKAYALVRVSGYKDVPDVVEFRVIRKKESGT